MKILAVNKFFFLNGGAERYFFDVNAALEEAGHTVIPFAMKDPRNQTTPYDRYFVDSIDLRAGKSLARAARVIYSREAEEKITQLVRDTQPDIAHLHNIARQLTPSIIRALNRAGVPVVQTLHDYQTICPNYLLYTQGSPCERCHVHKYWNAITHRCVQNSRSASAVAAAEMTLHNVVLKTYQRYVQRFIAPSRFLYEKLQKWGWRAEQLAYLPHFVEKQRCANVEKSIDVLFVGRLTKEKGVFTLIEAARQMPHRTFVFAGAGVAHAELEDCITKKKLTHCRVLGHQSTQEIDRLMQAARVVAVPSLWYENAPLVVIEALAFGTPVVASRRGGMPELVRDGHNGFLFEAGSVADLMQALDRALQRPVHIPENQYTKESHLSQLMEIYAQAIHSTTQ